MMRFAALDDQMRVTLLDNIVSLILGIVDGFLECVALRDRHNEDSVYPTQPTHPSELVLINGCDIALVVEKKKERPDVS